MTKYSGTTPPGKGEKSHLFHFKILHIRSNLKKYQQNKKGFVFHTKNYKTRLNNEILPKASLELVTT